MLSTAKTAQTNLITFSVENTDASWPNGIIFKELLNIATRTTNYSLLGLFCRLNYPFSFNIWRVMAKTMWRQHGMVKRSKSQI